MHNPLFIALKLRVLDIVIGLYLKIKEGIHGV